MPADQTGATLVLGIYFPEIDPAAVDPDILANEVAVMINEARSRNGGQIPPVEIDLFPGCQWLTPETLAELRDRWAQLTSGAAGATTEAPPEAPGFVQQAVIERFAALQEGWDSYGAQPITEKALNVLRALTVVPSIDGGVQLDIYVNGWETEIVFSPEGRPTCFISEASTKAPASGHSDVAGSSPAGTPEPMPTICLSCGVAIPTVDYPEHRRHCQDDVAESNRKPAEEKLVDLMASLATSLDEANAARDRHVAASCGYGCDDEIANGECPMHGDPEAAGTPQEAEQ